MQCSEHRDEGLLELAVSREERVKCELESFWYESTPLPYRGKFSLVLNFRYFRSCDKNFNLSLRVHAQFKSNEIKIPKIYSKMNPGNFLLPKFPISESSLRNPWIHFQR